MTQISLKQIARAGRLRAIQKLNESATLCLRRRPAAPKRTLHTQMSTLDRLMVDYDKIVFLMRVDGLPHPENA